MGKGVCERGGIYTNSTLTIAALKARMEVKVFSAHENRLSFQACILPPGELKMLNELHWDEECDDMGDSGAPLHKRAWAVQERLSSPRTLFFGSTGIFWECVLRSVRSRVRTRAFWPIYRIRSQSSGPYCAKLGRRRSNMRSS